VPIIGLFYPKVITGFLTKFNRYQRFRCSRI